MKNILLIVFLGSLSSLSLAQQGISEMERIERSKKTVDLAIEQAKAMQSNQAQGPSRPGLAPVELRKLTGVDLATLAEKFKNVGSVYERPSQDLMIFISTSMPPKALKMLGEQAKATGAVLVLRGLKGALGTKGVMEDTAKALQPVADTGAAIQIDPEAFGRYNVTAVPTFVIAAKTEGCGTEQCDSQAFALVGDVSLEYALEHWASNGGAAGKLANLYLRRLSVSE